MLTKGKVDYKAYNADFTKRGLRANRLSTGRPVVALVQENSTLVYRYLVIYGNIELHEDDGRRLG